MSVRMVCSHCGKKFRTKDEYLGQTVRCPGCRRAITIVHMPKEETDSPKESDEK